MKTVMSEVVDDRDISGRHRNKCLDDIEHCNVDVYDIHRLRTVIINSDISSAYQQPIAH